MSHDFINKRVDVSLLPTPTGANGGPVDFNATGDKFILTKPYPVDIYRWGFITIELMDPDAGGFQLDLDKRVTVGSDVGRVLVQSIVRADADTVAAGNVIYVESVLAVAQATGEDGVSLVNVGPAGPVRIEPGQEAVFEVSNAVGAASTGYIWVEYVAHPFNDAGYSAVTKDV